MRVYATTERQLFGKETKEGYKVAKFQSSSNPNKYYIVDITNGRCDCPAWKFQRNGREPCKHLRALGFTRLMGTDIFIQEPAKAQNYGYELITLTEAL